MCREKLNTRTMEFDHVEQMCCSYGEQTVQAVDPTVQSSESAVEERPTDDDPLINNVSVPV